MESNPTLTRRAVLKNIALGVGAAALFGPAMEISGCGNVYQDILNWVPVGESAVNSILSVLSSNGVAIAAPVQAIVDIVMTGFTDLTQAIKDYQSITPPPAGAVAKIQAAFNAIVSNFGNFLQQISVPGGIVSIVVGLANVIFSTIQAFVNEVPAVATPTLRAAVAKFTVAGATHVVAAKKRSNRAFRRDFDSVLDAGVKFGAVVPKSAYL